MATLIPLNQSEKREPKRKYILWGTDVCPKCRQELTIHWDEPVTLTLMFRIKKSMSLVTYYCPSCGYTFFEYEDNYGYKDNRGRLHRIPIISDWGSIHGTPRRML